MTETGSKEFTRNDVISRAEVAQRQLLLPRVVHHVQRLEVAMHDPLRGDVR